MSMKYAYENTDLHHFIVAYFNQLGSKVEPYDAYFEVQAVDGTKQKFTYSPTAISDDSSLLLLAAGSQSLKDIFNNATNKGCAAILDIKQSQDQIEDVIINKWKSISNCCSKCPQYGECNYGKCCTLCPERFTCHHLIVGSGIEKVTVEDRKLKLLFQFTFVVEILNPIRKQDELFEILVDPETGETFDPVNQELLQLNAFRIAKQRPIDIALYDVALAHARFWLEGKIQGNLAFLKQQTLHAVSDKAKALKYRLDLENSEGKANEGAISRYKQGLDQVQKQYAISVEIKTVSVLGLNTPEYQLEIQLKNGAHVPVNLNMATNTVAHPVCGICGEGAVEGWSCKNGHYVCDKCASRCCTCGDIYCQTCSDDLEHCTVCGEVVCNECTQNCAVCGKVVCEEHLYTCSNCGETKNLCLECVNICNHCGKDLCYEHVLSCSCCGINICQECSVKCADDECNKVLFKDHAKQCSYCHEFFCTTHVLPTVNGDLACRKHRAHCIECRRVYRIDDLKPCSLCGNYLCSSDQSSCYQCGKILCSNHFTRCKICGAVGCGDHNKECVVCGHMYCSTHILECSRCSQNICQEDARGCLGCGDRLCSCTSFSTCSHCGQEYCESCLKNGLCPACRSLKEANVTNFVVQVIKEIDPKVSGWKKWKVGKNSGCYVVEGSGGWLPPGKKLYVITEEGKLLFKKDFSIGEKVRGIINDKRKSWL